MTVARPRQIFTGFPGCNSSSSISEFRPLSTRSGAAAVTKKELTLGRSTRLTLVCHGATAASHAATFAADPPLEAGESGRAKALATRIGRFDRLFCSPAVCAVETAAALAADAAIDQALRDMCAGRWTGRDLAEVAASEPEALTRWMREPDFAPDGGESVSQLCERMQDWLMSGLDRGGHGVAVTHRAVIRAAVLTVLGSPPKAFWSLDPGYLGITTLTSDGRRWSLRSMS